MKIKEIKSMLAMLGPITWLSFASSLQMMGALLFFKASLDWVLISTYFFITFGIYLLNRFTDSEDTFNCPEQQSFFQKKAKLPFIPILLISASTILLLATKRLVLAHIVLIVLGTLYSVGLIPALRNRSLRFIRLKNILLVKNITVSLLWGITPFAIAASQNIDIYYRNWDLFVCILAFCLTTFINTVSCDVRDAPGDRQAGILTLATRLGKKSTGLFLLALGLLTSLVVVVEFLFGKVSTLAAILFFTTFFWTILVAIPIYIEKIDLPKSISEPLIDTQQIVCGISLIFLSINF